VASGIEATAPVMPLQGPTATEYARQQLATSGASSGGQPTAGDGAADTGGFGGQPPAGQPPAGDGRAAPQATWTLPVSEAGSTPGTQDGGSRSTSPEDRGSGPNVAILLIGLAALGVMAVFVRRRMI
jgi:hypothetical protein